MKKPVYKPIDVPLQLQQGLDSLEKEARKKLLTQLAEKATVKLVKKRLLK